MPSPTSTLSIRVRYAECDPMGVAHHTVYPVWFEMGRTELLREVNGLAYRDLEAAGHLLAVVSLQVKYKRPARYDDVLELRTTLSNLGRAKIEHTYELFRDGELLATAATTLACLDRDGRLQPIPPTLDPASA
ncbi:MAG: acyl-CoA thioesterase [Planctomycetota bacterium]|jgi:acyl-CoA thioester hydrolase